MENNRTSSIAMLVVVAAGLAGCSQVAVWSAPEKEAAAERRPSALQADALFWQSLHGGDYDGIPRVLDAMTAAYLENPQDATTAAHVGFLHVWRLAERERLGAVPAPITDHAVLGRKYFGEAVRLNPEDARLLGFYGALQLAEAAIHKDEKQTRKGYFTLLDSIEAWPEFNYFTAGYAMASLPHDSERFGEALDLQWRNLDVCAGRKLDRKDPSYAEFMSQETKSGPKRACWNSWIAPHNFEGFFLNMGDMMVKAGDVETAVKVYGMARLSTDYQRWKYRQVLEDRILQARRNVAPFRRREPYAGEARIMSNSRFACSACHER